MIVIVYKAVFLKLFQTKDHLANKNSRTIYLNIPGTTCLLPKTWRQTIVSAHMIFAGSPFVRTSRLVIDMTMRYAKHLEPCSMRDLVHGLILPSHTQTDITKHNDAHTDRSISLPTIGLPTRIYQTYIIRRCHYPTSHNTEYSYHLAVSAAGEKNAVFNATPRRDNAKYSRTICPLESLQ